MTETFDRDCWVMLTNGEIDRSEERIPHFETEAEVWTEIIQRLKAGLRGVGVVPVLTPMKLRRCLLIHCDSCGELAGEDEGCTHFERLDDAVTSWGWTRVGDKVYCQDCGPEHRELEVYPAPVIISDGQTAIDLDSKADPV